MKPKLIIYLAVGFLIWNALGFGIHFTILRNREDAWTKKENVNLRQINTIRLEKDSIFSELTVCRGYRSIADAQIKTTVTPFKNAKDSIRIKYDALRRSIPTGISPTKRDSFQREVQKHLHRNGGKSGKQSGHL